MAGGRSRASWQEAEIEAKDTRTNKVRTAENEKYLLWNEVVVSVAISGAACVVCGEKAADGKGKIPR